MLQLLPLLHHTLSPDRECDRDVVWRRRRVVFLVGLDVLTVDGLRSGAVHSAIVAAVFHLEAAVDLECLEILLVERLRVPDPYCRYLGLMTKEAAEDPALSVEMRFVLE